ncbi:alpha/beta fold hydrolase [Luteithermobacter gelatinilyticus]|uniref:alpha/beta fold hydrolase n=1 Tax=Luteithermobacter gelatinilyticus TaxID=2582913 RepID=UPI001105C5FA|nr:alpha/beta fold hydrolase [Luteithermobacter gelatinilyticus]|tara:strand:+ start:1083 stop:1913 length:831 start_codon:yes stop_codon:yes gene_type:complete
MRDRNGAPPRGAFVRAGEYRLHYHERGKGPAVVFVHGSGPGASGYSNFKLNIEAFAAAGYRVIVPDMIGFGYSDKPEGIDYTLDFFAQTLKQALEALGVRRCALVGNSLGGAVSLKIALDHPEFVERMVMMAPGGVEDLETYLAMPGMKNMIARFVAGGMDRAALREVLQTLTYDPSVVTPELVEERFVILQTQPRDVLSRMKIPNLAPRLGEIACPVLVFWGREDGFCPVSGAEKFRTQCARCRCEIVPDCGHWVMMEHADMFNRACLNFLKEGE